METMDIMIDSNMKMESEVLIDDFGMDNMMNEIAMEKSGLSDLTILIIVVSICAILGVVLGIVSGKKSANK